MRILKRAIPIAILLSIWAIASRLYASPLLPGPEHVTRALATFVARPAVARGLTIPARAR